MPTRLSHLSYTFGLLCCATLAACAAEQPPGPVGFGFTVGALGDANPLTDIKNFRLVVTGGETQFEAPLAYNGQKTISFPNVPAGSPRQVTLVGFNAAKQAAWFARQSGVTIQKVATTTTALTLMAVDDFTPVGNKDFPIPAAMYPAATKIQDGKILITGGFGHAVAENKDVTLESPSDQAYIFDPNNGTFKTTGSMKSARAGHSMIYLPKTNKVLVFGGAIKMHVAADGSAAPRWLVTEAVNTRYEIYDVAAGTFSSDDASQAFALPRVLANLLLLSDDSVVVAGGAVWPTPDEQAYRYCDLFSASSLTFKDTLKSLPTTGVRAGSATAYMGQTADGTSKYLLWGGNLPLGSDTTAGPAAERFTESTQLGGGVFYSDYKTNGDFYKVPGVLVFPTLTAIGPNKANNPRFLSVGGARYDIAKKAWIKPSADDVWLITVTDPSPEDAKGAIDTQRITGLGSGVFLHQANLLGGTRVVVSGGLSDFKTADAVIAAFKIEADPSADPPLVLEEQKNAANFAKRGTHSATTMGNDCVMLFGGGADFANALATQGGVATSEVYCPGFLVPK